AVVPSASSTGSATSTVNRSLAAGPTSTRYSKSSATAGRVTWNTADPSPVIGSRRPSPNTSTAESGTAAAGSVRSRYAERVTGSPRRTTGLPDDTTTRYGATAVGRYHGSPTRRSRSPEPGTTAADTTERRKTTPATAASRA